MSRQRVLPVAAVLTVLSLGLLAARSREPRQIRLDAEQFDRLRQLIRPAAGEARWAEVPWMPSTNIWAARQKAAAEGKPIFLWYMAGEPLGTC